MTKLTNKELLDWFEDIVSYAHREKLKEQTWVDEDEQAYQSLTSLLSAQEPTDEERKEMLNYLESLMNQCPSSFPRGYSRDEALRIENKILSLILSQSSKKMTRGFVERWAEKQAKYFLGGEIDESGKEVACDQIEEMLQEAGCEVEK